jgi:hypothetical protein
VFGLCPLTLFCFENGLSKHGYKDRLSINSDQNLISPLLGSSQHFSLSVFLLLHFLHLDGHLSLLFLLATAFLFIFTLFLSVFPFEPIFFLFELTLASFLPLFLLQVADQFFTRDCLALVAFPDALGHAVEVCTEEMIGLFAGAAVDKVAGVLAFEAIVGILYQSSLS